MASGSFTDTKSSIINPYIFNTVSSSCTNVETQYSSHVINLYKIFILMNIFMI